jgi:uncharacterized OB-fold protein
MTEAMSEYKLPIPVPRAESVPFWDGLKQDKFMLQYCDSCGKLNWFPRTHCVVCGKTHFTWKPSSGKGVLETYTIVYRGMNPAWQAETPYILGMVRLDEGIRMVTRIISDKGEKTPMNARVSLVCKPAGDDMKLPFFELVD